MGGVSVHVCDEYFTYKFESTNISETKEVTPTKIGVHVCYINPYLHDFFEPILSNKIF